MTAYTVTCVERQAFILFSHSTRVQQVGLFYHLHYQLPTQNLTAGEFSTDSSETLCPTSDLMLLMPYLTINKISLYP